MSFKYISFVDGPLAKYRFDIFLNGSPNIAKHLIIFCTEFSYNLYEKYHDKFEFVVIDDIRSKYPISIKEEFLPEYKSEEEWLSNINSFYGSNSKRFFPYETHRFILLWLAKRNILSFCIVDNDMLYQPDLSLHEKAFSNIKPGTFYLHTFGTNSDNTDRQLFFNNSVSNKFPTFSFNISDDFKNADGYIRGFHFKSKEDLLLFFNIWNESIEQIIKNRYNNIISNGNNIYQMEWVVAYIMQLFQNNFDYDFTDFHDLFNINGEDIIVHKTRVEDTIYSGPRLQWEHYNFNYSDIRTISNFIRNNKQQLYHYWMDHVAGIEITDTHVYTTLNRK